MNNLQKAIRPPAFRPGYEASSAWNAGVSSQRGHAVAADPGSRNRPFMQEWRAIVAVGSRAIARPRVPLNHEHTFRAITQLARLRPKLWVCSPCATHHARHDTTQCKIADIQRAALDHNARVSPGLQTDDAICTSFYSERVGSRLRVWALMPPLRSLLMPHSERFFVAMLVGRCGYRS